MQKVIRRTILAEKQAARRHAKRKDKATREWAKTNREQNRFVQRDIVKNLKDARIHRREDWELGPLAPRRDVGDSKETYGTVGTNRLRGEELDHRAAQEKLKPFGGNHLNIVTGDRVVLLEGRDKGKIGKITATDTKRAECTVEGLNLVRFSSLLYPLLNSNTDTKLQRWMSHSPNGCSITKMINGPSAPLNNPFPSPPSASSTPSQTPRPASSAT
jgi:large subunit ribosomal protein L24